MTHKEQPNLEQLKHGLRDLKRLRPIAFGDIAALENLRELAYNELQRRAGNALRLLHSDLVEMIAFDNVDVRKAVCDVIAE